MEAAKAKAGDQPYVMFFCSEQQAKSAGEGAPGHAAYLKEYKRPATNTVFDNVTSMAAFKAAGIESFVKVPAAKANLEVYKKYRAALDGSTSLVICAPSGEAVASFIGANCNQTAVLGYLRTFKPTYAAWQKAHAGNSTASR